MVPLNIKDLKRKVANKADARVIYLLYEGQNTEPLFLRPFLESSNYISSKEVRFKEFEKNGRDIGATNVEKLISLAKKFKNNAKEYKKGFDKIIIFFDLDVFKNNQEKINGLLDLIDNDIILAYTNPSIELFLLLTIKNSYENIIEPRKKEILKNEFIGKKRYVYDLLLKTSNINSKSKDGQVALFSENIEVAIQQENLFINTYIDKASKELTSNIGYIFSKIKNNDFYIQYKSKK
ncbi:MAG: RloB family protein [Erysipelotrichaceae bacterium]|nr:RloB family protein [Erysipelotrichaceae bacterium]